MSKYTFQDMIPGTGKLPGIYRGVVEDNKDPDKRGRVRVRIFGVMTANVESEDTQGIPVKHLPWAEPVLSTFGGAITGVGAFYVPVQGSHVFVFFENGNAHQPRYFATSPGVPQKESEKGKGFNDPEGKWPDKDLLKQPDWNRLARDETEKTIVEDKKDNLVKSVPVAAESAATEWNEPEPYYDDKAEESGTGGTSGYSGKYPYNNVIQTSNKLTIELDDTKDATRFHLYHPSNSYLELNKDGNMVFRNVGSRYEIIGSEDSGGGIGGVGEEETKLHNVYVMGEENITITKDATKKVMGDYVEEIGTTGNMMGLDIGGITGMLGQGQNFYKRIVRGDEDKYTQNKSVATTGLDHNIFASGGQEFAAKIEQKLFGKMGQKFSTYITQEFNAKANRMVNVWGNHETKTKGRRLQEILGISQEKMGGLWSSTSMGITYVNSAPPHFVSSPTRVNIGASPVGSSLGSMISSLSGMMSSLRAAMEPMLAAFSALQGIINGDFTKIIAQVKQILTPITDNLMSEFGAGLGSLVDGADDVFGNVFEGVGFDNLKGVIQGVNIGQIKSLTDYVMKEYQMSKAIITQVQDSPRPVVTAIINDASMARNQSGMVIASTIRQLSGTSAGVKLLEKINTLYMNANDMGMSTPQMLSDYRELADVIDVFALPGRTITDYGLSKLSNSNDAGTKLLKDYGDGFGDKLPTTGNLSTEIGRLNNYIDNTLTSCFFDPSGAFQIELAIEHSFEHQAEYIESILLKFSVDELLVNPGGLTLSNVEGGVVSQNVLNEACGTPTVNFSNTSSYNGSLGYGSYNYTYGEKGSYTGAGYFIDQSIIGELLTITYIPWYVYSGWSGVSGESGYYMDPYINEQTGEYVPGGWYENLEGVSGVSGYSGTSGYLNTSKMNLTINQNLNGSITSKARAILNDAKYTRMPNYAELVAYRNCEACKEIFNGLIALEDWANNHMADVDYDTVNWDGKFGDWPEDDVVPAPSSWFEGQ